MSPAEILGLRQRRGNLIELNKRAMDRMAAEKDANRVKELETEWDARDLDIAALGEQLERALGGERRELRQRVNDAEMAQPLQERKSGRLLATDDLDQWEEGREGFVETETGKFIPLLRHDERLVKAERGVRRGGEIHAGHVMYRALHGRWQNARVENEAREMSIGTDADGGFMVPQPLSLEVLDFARALARCLQAGVRTIPMDSNTLDLASIKTDPTWSWKAEGAAGVSSQPTIGRVRLQTRTVMALIPVTGELWDDAKNLPEVLQSLLIGSLSAEIDRCILHGGEGGSPNQEPTGLYTTSGVGVYTYGGTIADYNWVSQAVQTVRTANLEPTAMISHPRVYGDLDRLKDTTNQPLQPPRSFNELKHFATTNVSINEGSPSGSVAFVGDWKNIALGMRMGLQIRVSQDGSTASDNAMTEFKKFIVAVARMDVAVLLPKAFCIVKDLGLY